MQYSWWLTLLFSIYSAIAIAQPLPDYDLHAVWLVDKKDTPFSVFHPQQYLSTEAIIRKERQGISIDKRDLPLSPSYLQKIKSLDISIHSQSRWLNVVIIKTTDKNKLYQLNQLPFVLKVKPVGKSRTPKSYKLYSKRTAVDSSQHIDAYYGHAATQIQQLNGDWLHQLGYSGQEVSIGIVDGGYSNAYRTAVFDKTYQNHHLLGTKDFVDGDQWVYQSSTHGTNVWSTMAANTPGLMVGTAPDANYYLFRTEDTQDEFPIEEFNWVIAMEYADSVGVEVINSSLGYSVFRDKKMSYSYQDMNGSGTYIAQGARIATQKGLLIVNAAGNDGNKEWHYLFAPADVTDVLTVGSVDEKRDKADFSGWGPTVDGRLKPDVAALGVRATMVSIVTYGISYSNGTSYSSPILCGLVASLKGAFPNATNEQIRAAIKKSGHQAHAPSSSLGYGVPDFRKAYAYLAEATIWITKEKEVPTISSPLIIQDQLSLMVEQYQPINLSIAIQNTLGNTIIEKKIPSIDSDLHHISLPSIKHLPKGVYSIAITSTSTPAINQYHSFIKLH